MRGKNRNVKIQQVYDWDNLEKAVKEGSKGKKNKYGYKVFMRNPKRNLLELQKQLKEGTWKASPPKMVEEETEGGKIRLLAKVPFFPDHIVHHALMQVLEPSMYKSYHKESAASIKGRGIHYCARSIRKWLKRHEKDEVYFAKLDFIKFYHNIDQQKVLTELEKFYGDLGIRKLLREIIESLPKGLAIGFFLIQPIANFYLNRLDRHPILRKYNIKLIRYCDDILLLSYTGKDGLWKTVNEFVRYSNEVLCQPVHNNLFVRKWSEKNPIDMVGYKFYPKYVRIRKEMKKRFARKLKNISEPTKRQQMKASYKGWLQFCGSGGLDLWKKLTGMKSFKDLGLKLNDSLDKDGKRIFNAEVISPSMILNTKIIIKDAELDIETQRGKGRCIVLIDINGVEKKFITNNSTLKDIMKQCIERNLFPFEATLKMDRYGNVNNYYLE